MIVQDSRYLSTQKCFHFRHQTSDALKKATAGTCLAKEEGIIQETAEEILRVEARCVDSILPNFDDSWFVESGKKSWSLKIEILCNWKVETIQAKQNLPSNVKSLWLEITCPMSSPLGGNPNMIPLSECEIWDVLRIWILKKRNTFSNFLLLEVAYLSGSLCSFISWVFNMSCFPFG